MQLHNHQNDPFQPTHFMTVYTRMGEEPHTEHYMEIGPILKTEEGYKVGPSAPATLDFLNKLAQTIQVQNFRALKFKGMIPKNVLWAHCDSQHPTIAWFRESEKQTLHFSANMGIESGTYEMPNMIFTCKGGTLSVYRLQNPVLEDNTPLFMMPLPNIYSSCSVCLGTTKTKMKPAKCLEEYIANMEAMFYKTSFNALHHTLMGEGVIYTHAIAAKNFEQFPFVPVEKTLKKLIDELS